MKRQNHFKIIFIPGKCRAALLDVEILTVYSQASAVKKKKKKNLELVQDYHSQIILRDLNKMCVIFTSNTLSQRNILHRFKQMVYDYHTLYIIKLWWIKTKTILRKIWNIFQLGYCWNTFSNPLIQLAAMWTHVMS